MPEPRSCPHVADQARAGEVLGAVQAPQLVEVDAVEAQVDAPARALARGHQRPRAARLGREAPGAREVLAGEAQVDGAVGGGHDDLVERGPEELRLRVDGDDDVAPLEGHARDGAGRAEAARRERREPDHGHERRQRRDDDRRRRDGQGPPARRPQRPARARPRRRRPRGDEAGLLDQVAGPARLPRDLEGLRRLAGVDGARRGRLARDLEGLPLLGRRPAGRDGSPLPPGREHSHDGLELMAAIGWGYSL